MGYRGAVGFMTLAMALLLMPAEAHDEAKYPDWRGQWVRIGAANFDPGKPPGLGQQAPLTPEYQAILETSVASQAAGGQGNNPMARCIPPGMPRIMIGYGGIEVIITQATTFLVFADPMRQIRRIYTDARTWPERITPSYIGYSIGQWIDADKDGRYDTLEVETRGFKFPRVYENSGIPLHADNKTVIKEKIYQDRTNPNILYADVTVIDNALTRPWSVKRTYGRQRNAIWFEAICGEDDHQVRLGAEDYFLSADKHLMPTRKDQPPPDLKYFNQSAR